MLKLNNKSARIIIGCVLVSTLMSGCNSTPSPRSIAPPVQIGPTQQEVMFKHIDNNDYSSALEVVEQLLKTAPDEQSYKLIKAQCLFMTRKKPDARKETELYLSSLSKELDKSSPEWTTNEKMRMRNFFYMKSPQSARKAQQIFENYRTTTSDSVLAADDLFWGGLIAKVCLDEEKGNAYWSRLSQSYIEKQKQELKQYK